jgi:hypothetical protein
VDASGWLRRVSPVDKLKVASVNSRGLGCKRGVELSCVRATSSNGVALLLVALWLQQTNL